MVHSLWTFFIHVGLDDCDLENSTGNPNLRSWGNIVLQSENIDDLVACHTKPVFETNHVKSGDVFESEFHN